MPTVKPRPTVLTPRKSPNTVSDLTRKQQIGDLITHLGKADPHLFQALTSLQGQNNQIVENISDLVVAINNLTAEVAKAIGDTVTAATGKHTVVTIVPPSVPLGGGIRGFISKSGGSGGNTKPVPPKVSA